jgi:hypothetical protein
MADERFVSAYLSAHDLGCCFLVCRKRTDNTDKIAETFVLQSIGTVSIVTDKNTDRAFMMAI